MVDLDTAINLLEKVKHELTVTLNDGSPPRCGNCKEWEEPLGGRRKHGVCLSLMAGCKTYDRLRTLPEFGCIYHKPKE